MLLHRSLPRLSLVAALLVLAGCTPDISEFSLEVQAVTLGPRAAPGGDLQVSITARNSGKATWEPGKVELAFEGETGWTETTLRLSKAVSRNGEGAFTGTLKAPPAPGIHTLHWHAAFSGKPFGPTIDGTVEVTCSDGIFCNGAERFVDGACALAVVSPCNDGAACTYDRCEEATGTCSHELGDGCAACFSDCTPDCSGKVCGGDGCGGSCGECSAGEACAAVVGECRPVSQPGTCASPLALLPGGTPLEGDHEISGDTSNALHQAVPTCNSTSTAVEVVYTFTVTARVGLEARSSGYDTVLHLRKENPGTPANECLDGGAPATVACSDDASPPGDYGSRIEAALDPGTYYLIVDGFDSAQAGPFTLKVRFVPGGCVPSCDGRFCGTDDGCGGNCGICGTGFACVKGRCKADPCVPDCTGKSCGDNGCGGSCGTCSGGALCVPATSQCQTFAACNHERPTCNPACGATSFCGTDCACHAVGDPMPDLVLDVERLKSEVRFDNLVIDPASCAYVEQCVGGIGPRRVLRFSVEAKNQGQATLTVPPPADRPDLFTFSPCHGHYHFLGFATYSLLDLDGREVVAGRKQAYCMEDTRQIAEGPNVPCAKKYDCGNQGIQAGWSDLYGNALDCQWLDITDIPRGNYQIRVTLNPGRTFEEITLENNSATVPVTIP
jgi:hypothetical protein